MGRGPMCDSVRRDICGQRRQDASRGSYRLHTLKPIRGAQDPASGHDARNGVFAHPSSENSSFGALHQSRPDAAYRLLPLAFSNTGRIANGLPSNPRGDCSVQNTGKIRRDSKRQSVSGTKLVSCRGGHIRRSDDATDAQWRVSLYFAGPHRCALEARRVPKEADGIGIFARSQSCLQKRDLVLAFSRSQRSCDAKPIDKNAGCRCRRECSCRHLHWQDPRRRFSASPTR